MFKARISAIQSQIKQLHEFVFCAHLFMFICILVLFPLLSSDDLGMVYVYEYVLLSYM